MKAIIVNYRLSNKNRKWNQVILKVEGINSREEAKALLGKKVILKHNGKIKVGKITRLHGNKGKVIARFKKGISPYFLLKEVEIV